MEKSLKAIYWIEVMEEAILSHYRQISTEHKSKFIEFLKIYNSKDIDEHAERRKKLGSKNYIAVVSSFSSFLMCFFDTSDTLKKIESESQSHST